jgi:hypothetical protein
MRFRFGLDTDEKRKIPEDDCRLGCAIVWYKFTDVSEALCLQNQGKLSQTT